MENKVLITRDIQDSRHSGLLNRLLPSAVRVAEGNLGRRLFASRNITRGENILSFAGPVIDFNAAVAKGDKQCYPLQIGIDRYLDLVQPGCFANHSCEPNAGIKNLGLKALVDIPQGVEVRFDYSTSMDEDHWEMSCLCGAPSCRGVVNDFIHLPISTRERYLCLGIVMPFIVARLDSIGAQFEDLSREKSLISDETRRLRARPLVGQMDLCP